MGTRVGLLLIWSLWESLAYPCAREVELLAPRSISELKATHGRYQPTRVFDHEQFRTESQKLPAANAVAFVMEHAYLKQLNEKVFGDREVTQGTTNILKSLFLENLSNSPLAGNVSAIYADYKGVRIIFRGNRKVVESSLDPLIDKSAKDFSRALDEYPEIKRRIKEVGDNTDNPLHWFHSGLGATVDAAAARARMSRFEELPLTRAPPLKSFENPAEIRYFAQQLHDVESIRAQLQRAFATNPEVMKPAYAGSPEQVPSARALRILSHASREMSHRGITGFKGYAAYVEAEFKKAFDLDITNEQVKLLQAYAHGLDFLAPTIFTKDPSPVDLTQTAGDVLWIDLMGQGSRNLHALAKQLHLATKKSKEDLRLYVSNALRLTREGQDVESRRFEKRLEYFESTLSELGLVGDTDFSENNGVRYSGDEGAFATKQSLTQEQFSVLVQRLAAKVAWKTDTDPSFYRIVYSDSRYEKDGSPFPKAKQSALVKQAEEVEKQLREGLESSGVSHGRLKNILLGIRITPYDHAQIRVSLTLNTIPSTTELSQLEKEFTRLAKLAGWVPRQIVLPEN